MRGDNAPGNAAIQENASSNESSHLKWRDIMIVVAVAWAARLAFIIVVPSGSRSFDAFVWEKVADLLKEGVNPYQATVFLNWPPFWMQFIFVISKIAAVFNVSFFAVLRVALILFETAVIVQVMRLIKMIAPSANARAIAMVGIALNPVAILLVCQHCNFDIIMALWMLLAAEGVVRYNQSRNIMDWLWACLFLGLGILTKTVPLALVPLLAGGFQKANAYCRILGGTLVLGPPALGMSVIFVLSPGAVLSHVLEYRPDSTSFGFPGLMGMLGIKDFAGYFDRGFYLLGFVTMGLTWRFLWKNHSLGNRETVLFIAMVLLAIPVLGPGFGSQYCYWFLPFLVITYACYPGTFQKLLIGVAVIAVITFILQYGFNEAYGWNFIYLLSHAPNPGTLYQWIRQPNEDFSHHALKWAAWLSTPGHRVLQWTLFFIGALAVLAFGTRIVLLSANAPRKWVRTVTGCYAFYIMMVFGLGLGAKYIQEKGPLSPPASSTEVDNTPSF